ncbi:unnamed protein product [Pleuronectes platessa]|uniref:Uncharacterized protein n=1 Tax=Pleuronectes platessa TaxID=8262 RepID=A0A9N7YRQ6_PLEPL|nr:unnamed protein product [Pleuronectes platessa]
MTRRASRATRIRNITLLSIAPSPGSSETRSALVVERDHSSLHAHDAAALQRSAYDPRLDAEEEALRGEEKRISGPHDRIYESPVKNGLNIVCIGLLSWSRTGEQLWDDSRQQHASS